MTRRGVGWHCVNVCGVIRHVCLLFIVNYYCFRTQYARISYTYIFY